MKLGARELRVSEPKKSDLAKIKRRQIYIICDNIMDTYNIGSIFRLADAVAAKRVYLCGQSETPPNSRISKAAVGTDKWGSWKYASTASEAIAKVKSLHFAKASQNKKRSKFKIIAIEQGKGSVDFRKAKYEEQIAFIVGHETNGISKEALKLADQIVEIPIFGVNKSLNVMVSLAIVLFRASESLS